MWSPPPSIRASLPASLVLQGDGIRDDWSAETSSNSARTRTLDDLVAKGEAKYHRAEPSAKALRVLRMTKPVKDFRRIARDVKRT